MAEKGIELAHSLLYIGAMGARLPHVGFAYRLLVSAETLFLFSMVQRYTPFLTDADKKYGYCVKRDGRRFVYTRDNYSDL